MPLSQAWRAPCLGDACGWLVAGGAGARPTIPFPADERSGHCAPMTGDGNAGASEPAELKSLRAVIPDPTILPAETFPTCDHLNSRLHASAEAMP